MEPAFEIIAHRYGNSLEALARVEGIADVIEVDVHPHQDRVQVRHAKRLWLTARHWERWFLLPAESVFPDLQTIVGAAAPDTRFWIDCKGVDPRLADTIDRLVAADRPLTVSSKSWWILHRFRSRARTRVIRSAGNRFELFLLRHLPSRVRLDGVVVHQRLLDQATATELRRRFDAVFTWAVTDRARADALRSWGVRGVILDDLELIRELAGR